MPRRTVDPRFPGRLRKLRQARGLSYRKLAALAFCSKSMIAELESGSKTPSTQIVAHLDRALDADGELSGMVVDAPAGEPAAPGLAAVALPPAAPAAQPMDGPAVERLRQVIGQLVALDNAYGADDIAGVAVRAFRGAHRRLATGAFLPAVEADLQATVGELGALAAWLLYDADRQDESRRIALEALTVSRLAGDRSIELLGESHLTMQGVHLRQGREALRIAEHVLDRDRLTTRLTGLFRLREARALASLGDRVRALDALAAAEADIGDGAGGRDPAWAWWIDEAELTWHEAMLHADLGDHHRAVDVHQAGVEIRRRGGSRRSCYNELVHVADAATRVAAWGEAEPALAEVASYVSEVGSRRTERLLGQVVARIRRAPGVPSGLRDLADALAGQLSTVR